MSHAKASNPNIPSQSEQSGSIGVVHPGFEHRLTSFLFLFVDALAQVVQFINEVFVPFNPHNHAVYHLKQISTQDIFRIVSGYTDDFDDKNVKSFTTWCAKKKLHFFKAEDTRKKPKITL